MCLKGTFGYLSKILLFRKSFSSFSSLETVEWSNLVGFWVANVAHTVAALTVLLLKRLYMVPYVVASVILFFLRSYEAKDVAVQLGRNLSKRNRHEEMRLSMCFC